MDAGLIERIYHAEPSLTFCAAFDGTSPLWNYELHRHPYIEAIYRRGGRGRTDTLHETQQFTYFDTLVYPVDCWHQDKFEATPENDCYCLWIDIPGVTLERPLLVQEHNGALGSLFPKRVTAPFVRNRSACCRGRQTPVLAADYPQKGKVKPHP